MAKKKSITAASSDKEIMALIKRVNSKIRSNVGASASNLGLSVAEQLEMRIQTENRIQNMLTFTHGKETDKLELIEQRNGTKIIPATQQSVDYIRAVLKRQETATAKQKEIDPSYEHGLNIAMQLDNIMTFNEKVKKAEKDLKNTDYNSYSGETLKPIKKDMTSEEKKEIKQSNARAAAREVVAMTYHEYEESFEDAIAKLYEDEEKYGDLIDKLKKHQKWTGDLMDEVNAATHGIALTNIF